METPLLLDATREDIPQAFIWPEQERPKITLEEELEIPIIDLRRSEKQGICVSDDILLAINQACVSNGFFQVVNHGIDSKILASAHTFMDKFFNACETIKHKAQRKLGESSGFHSSFIGRFACNLPWKETLSIEHTKSAQVKDYIANVIGDEFMGYSEDLEKYCKEMADLGLDLFEMLGLSMGVDGLKVRKVYEGGSSILRFNNYPPCRKPELVLGTGPHCDPTSLTILHQEQSISGLQVFVDNKWFTVKPVLDALVINIGDTFMALSNGIYKSCLHRAVVNSTRPRKSIAYFMNPPMDKMVRPLAELAENRKYPDFTWEQLLHFTQKHYRADMNTLPHFSKWLTHSV